MRLVRRFLVLLSIALASGCSLPALPSPASLLPVASTGDSLKDADKLAEPLATAWDANAQLVQIEGTDLDPGGRDGGYSEGTWLFSYSASDKQTWLFVTVKAGKTTKTESDPQPLPGAPLGRDLSALLDSPDAVAKSGVSAKVYTVILRQNDSGPVYNVLEENGTGNAVIDARTGAQLPN